MKKSLVFFLFALFPISFLLSQNTKINFIIGGEASDLEEFEYVEPNPTTPIYFNEGFKEVSFLFGLELEQTLIYDFDCIFRTSLGRKYVSNTLTTGIFSNPSFEFNHIYNSALIRKNIYRNLKVGSGIGYNLFQYVPNKMKFKNEIVGIIETSYNINKFNLGLAYSFGLQKEYFIRDTKPSKSLQFTIGYRLFDIVWKKRGGKVDCPTI